MISLVACALVWALCWPRPLAADPPPELSEERARELLLQIDHSDYERRQSAERILRRRLGERLPDLIAREFGEPMSASIHIRWRLGLLLDPGLAGDRIPDDVLFDSTQTNAGGQGLFEANAAELDGTAPAKTVRDLLLELQAGQRYSTDEPSYVAMLQLGADARQQFLDAILDPSLSNTLHYYALMAYQRVAPPEVLMEDLGTLLIAGDSYLVSNIGQAFRNAGVPPDPVMALARSANPAMRVLAAQAMANMRYSPSGTQAPFSEQVRDALLELLGDPIIDVAVAALGGLRNMGSRLAGDARVLEAASSGDDELAATALECLRLSNEPEAVRLAAERATAGSPLVRARALAVVGQGARMQPGVFAEVEGARILEEAVAAEELGVRIAAYDAIGSSQITQLTPLLREVLNRTGSGVGALEVAAVIRNLSNLQDMDSLDALASKVEDTDDGVRTSALSGLRRLAYRADAEQAARIRQAFRKVLHHTHSTTRYYAAQYLANIADEDSLEDLAPLIEDTDSSVRRAVHSGLAQLRGNEGAAALLARALRIDPEPMNRQSVARSLMNLGVETAGVAEALKAALEDEDAETRVVAAEAMQRLGIPGSEEVRLRELLRMVELSPSYANLCKLRQAYADADEPGEAAAVSPRVITMMPAHLPPGYEHVIAARFALAADDQEAALGYLREAVELGYPNVRSLRADSALQQLRENEEFLQLTERPR